MLRAHQARCAALIGGYARTAEAHALVRSGWAHDVVGYGTYLAARCGPRRPRFAGRWPLSVPGPSVGRVDGYPMVRLSMSARELPASCRSGWYGTYLAARCGPRRPRFAGRWPLSVPGPSVGRVGPSPIFLGTTGAAVLRDGVAAPRPVRRSTFYRNARVGCWSGSFRPVSETGQRESVRPSPIFLGTTGAAVLRDGVAAPRPVRRSTFYRNVSAADGPGRRRRTRRDGVARPRSDRAADRRPGPSRAVDPRRGGGRAAGRTRRAGRHAIRSRWPRPPPPNTPGWRCPPAIRSCG